MYLGATKPIYAPEPSDVGRLLEAEVISDRLSITLTTSGPIELGLSVKSRKCPPCDALYQTQLI